MNTNRNEQTIERLINLIRGDEPDDVIRQKIEGYHDNDIAEALRCLDSRQRKKLYQILGVEKLSNIFTYVDDIATYIEELDLQRAADVIENMDADDAVDALEEVDTDKREQLIEYIAQDAKDDIELICSYEDDEIGSQMTTNFIEITRSITVKQAMKQLIEQAEENDNISTIYVKDEGNKYYGAIELKDLIRAREYVKLETLISTSYPFVRDHEKINECIERLKDYAEDSIPVLDDNDILLGVITSQNMVEVVDDEMSDDYAKLAGLTSEEDLSETLLQSMKKRLPWLCILLILGMGVSSVVGAFERVVSHVALLVCFQSLILDMAGNVGTQSLAVTIRVLMDEQLSNKSKIKLVLKEIRVGFCNGLLLGTIAFISVGIYIMVLKNRGGLYAFSLSGCVGVALLVSMTISSMVGTIIPLFFHRIHIDPAVASGPLITTMNDFVAVITYYGVAWILLINIMKF